MPIILSKTFFFSLFIIVMMFLGKAFAIGKYDSDLTWKTIETPHFVIHYQNGLEKIAYEMADYGEQIQGVISNFFNWTPKAKTHVVLSDQFDSPNGFATVLPYNRIEIYATPPADLNSLEDYDNWKELVFKHEYVHTVQVDKASDFPLHLRNLLGRWWVLFPGQFMPSWIKEGIATYIETDNEKGIGRGQSSYFRGLMRNELINGLKPLSVVNQTPFDWPDGTTPYLYGVYFFNFLNDHYGEATVKEFFEFYQSIPVPFFLNYSAKRTIGFDFDTLWQQFEEYLAKQFKDEIENIQAESVESTQLTFDGYATGFSRLSQSGSILYIENDQEKQSRIIEYNPETNRKTTLLNLNPQFISQFNSFDYHAENGLVIPITDLVGNSRYPTDLHIFDLETKSLNKITHDGRFIRASWSPDGDSIAAVHVENGQHTLFLLDTSGNILEELSKPGHDFVIGPIDWSPQGDKIVASVFRPNSGWNLELFNIDAKQWLQLTNNPSIEFDPVFHPNGEKLLYTAEYSSVYNIHEFNLLTQSAHRITNSLSIARQPSYSNKETEIYFAELGANGFDLHRVSTENMKSVYIPDKRQFSLIADSKKQELRQYASEDYQALKHLKPTWWFPFLLLSEEESSLGFTTSSNDPLGWHNYYTEFDYDFKNNNPGWLLSYVYQRFYPNLIISSARESYHSTLTLTQHENLHKLEVELPFAKNRYRLSAKTSFEITDIEREFSSPLASFSRRTQTEHWVVSLSLDTRNIRRRAFLPYDGVRATFMLENEDLEQEVKRNSRAVARMQYVSPLLKQNIIDLEATIVMSGGLTEPLSVGGYFREPQRLAGFTRRNYNLKGYPSASFSGSSMQRLQLSWNLFAAKPQASIMTPPIGVSRVFFKTYGMVARVGNYEDIGTQPWYRSIGTEIQINSNFGYRIWPFALIAGVAKGLDERGELKPYLEVSFAF